MTRAPTWASLLILCAVLFMGSAFGQGASMSAANTAKPAPAAPAVAAAPVASTPAASAPVAARPAAAKPQPATKAPAATRAAPRRAQRATPIATETAAPPAQGTSRTPLSFAPNALSERGTKSGINAYAMPADTKLVVFPYDPNYTYPLFSRAGLFTHIALPANEKVVGFYLSDQLRWQHHVSKNRNSVFVLPTQDALFTSATLETTVRTYELTLTSVAEPENWYQRVSWHIPMSNFEEEIAHPEDKTSAEVDAFPNKATAANRPGSPPAARGLPTADAGKAQQEPDLVDLSKVNFNYTVEGNAPFKPTMVFDDGRFTWFKLPPVQDAPVLFALAKDGTAEPQSFVPRGGFLVVSRLLPYGGLLRVGDVEVRVKNKAADCGFFGSDCWKGNGARNIVN